MNKPTAIDLAEALLDRLGSMDTFKLQKLVFYANAWYATWTGEALVEDRFEAWENGPVSRRLYNCHKGRYRVGSVGGNAHLLPDDAEAVLAFVEAVYGEHAGEELVNRVHAERPWSDAYGRSRNSEITTEAVREFYSSHDLNRQAWIWLSGAYREAEASEAELDGRASEGLGDDDFLEALTI